MNWRKIGAAVEMTIGASVMLVVIVAGIAGTLTHPRDAVWFVLFSAWLFLFLILIRNLKMRIKQRRSNRTNRE
jgi:hypothetical protein